MAQEIDNKLEQLKALLEELGATNKYNIFMVVEDSEQKETMSGLCGKGNDIKAALCYAYDNNIVAFKVAVYSILTYAEAQGTLNDNNPLFNSILALMHETVAARKREIQETNKDEDNG